MLGISFYYTLLFLYLMPHSDIKSYGLLEKFDLQTRVKLIAEVQHQIQDLYNQVIVIKYGGSTFKTKNFGNTVLDDISILHKSGVKPIIVHGGGPSITEETKLRGIKAKFIDGLRVTDKKTLDITEMVLSGKVNKSIVGLLNSYGIAAVGLSGKDGKTIVAKKKKYKKDLGFVGEIIRINPKVIEFLISNNYIPVISPIGIGEDNVTYNINADTVAAAIAISIGATRVLFLTDVGGIMKDGKLLSTVTFNEVTNLIKTGVISGGMIPKIEAMMECFKGNVNKVYIANGNYLHPIIGELFSSTGVGTMVVRS